MCFICFLRPILYSFPSSSLAVMFGVIPCVSYLINVRNTVQTDKVNKLLKVNDFVLEGVISYPHPPRYLFPFFFPQALMKEGEFDRSKQEFKKAQYYDPNNKAIKDALIDLDR